MTEGFDTKYLNPLQRIAFIMLDGMVRKFLELTGGGIWIVTAVPVAKDRVEMITLGAGCQCEECQKMTKDLLPAMQDVAIKALTERHGEFKIVANGEHTEEEVPCLPDCSEGH